MGKIIKIIIGFFICFMALFLPYRLRILYSEIIGRIINSFYGLYIKMVEYILKEVS
ncbi:MAG: hypothetical protein ABIH27_02025 [Candidatus Omnitrophota bacterium]